METATTNKVFVLDDMKALGVAVAEGYAQQADGSLPLSLRGSMRTLSERLAEGMSNEFYRIKDSQNNEASANHAQDFLNVHDRYMQYIPGYREEFEKINSVR